MKNLSTKQWSNTKIKANQNEERTMNEVWLQTQASQIILKQVNFLVLPKMNITLPTYLVSIMVFYQQQEPILLEVSSTLIWENQRSWWNSWMIRVDLTNLQLWVQLVMELVPSNLTRPWIWCIITRQTFITTWFWKRSNRCNKHGGKTLKTTINSRQKNFHPENNLKTQNQFKIWKLPPSIGKQSVWTLRIKLISTNYQSKLN